MEFNLDTSNGVSQVYFWLQNFRINFMPRRKAKESLRTKAVIDFFLLSRYKKNLNRTNYETDKRIVRAVRVTCKCGLI